MIQPFLEHLRGGIVISCQATPPNPLAGPDHMAVMAAAAEQGGAVAIRADGPDDIAAIKRATALPVIGINKVGRDVHPVYITPTFESAAEVARSGSDLIAVDGTQRARPRGETLPGLIARIHNELRVPVMADVDTVEAGRTAADAGADLVATTLSGYTGDARPQGPDIELIARLRRAVDVPVVAEGRYRDVQDIRLAFAAGALAVVVGTAVTNPVAITRRLVGWDGAR